MHILRIILIGVVAGIIAKLVTPGDNEPHGFILTTILGHRRRVRRHIPRPGDQMVRPGPECGTHWSGRGRGAYTVGGLGIC
jgi:hypothetical protein